MKFRIFTKHFAKFEEQVTICGYSQSTLFNYSRAVAKISRYFKKTLPELSGHEFLRRFCQHNLPSGFARIRHYGILASKNKSVKLNHARSFFGMDQWEKPEEVAWQQVAQERMNFIPEQCPNCKKEVMQVIAAIDPQRGPPLKVPGLKLSNHAN